MRAAQDFSATPILADALQDAGCDDTDLLTYLRSDPRTPNPWPVKAAPNVSCDTVVRAVLTALIADPVAAGQAIIAVADFMDVLPVEVDILTLLQTALSAIGRGTGRSHISMSTDITSNIARGGKDLEAFWDAFGVIWGCVIPRDARTGLFSCAC
jgi:hypothetical protein